MYLKRCKTLLVSEGYVRIDSRDILCRVGSIIASHSLSHVVLHALCASIPHAMLLLHALLDILPYPKQYVTYEIRTSTTACTDEMFGKRGIDDEDGDLLPFEEEESEMRTRSKASMRKDC
jgi:hypothetical protein